MPDTPLDPRRAARRISSSLGAAGRPDRAVQEKRYLKSALEHFGVSVPVIRRVARDFAGRHPDLRGGELTALVARLWEEPVHECRMAAVAGRLVDRFPELGSVLDRWARGKERPDLVLRWLLPRAGRASGLTVREAVKYLPEERREEILAATGRARTVYEGPPSSLRPLATSAMLACRP